MWKTRIDLSMYPLVSIRQAGAILTGDTMNTDILRAVRISATILTLSLLSTLVAATAANAQFAANTANPFTGCYVGAGAGVGFTETSTNYRLGPFGLGADLGNSGSLLSLGGGCDAQLSSGFLIGVFADYDWRDNDASANLFGLPVKVETGNNWTVGGRMGWVLNNYVLAYGLLGYTGSESSRIKLANFSRKVGSSGGWTLGGGMETLLTDSLRVGAEYRYTDVDEKSIRKIAYYSDRLSVDREDHSARITFKYVFGAGGGQPPPLK